MVNELNSTAVSKRERYSFTKLSAWWTCPYGWRLRYIEGLHGIGNAFSSYGSFVHEIMEKYAKGEAEIWDLPSLFEWGFDVNVPEKFPYNKYVELRESYYKQGLEFLKSFQGYDKYKILGVEKDFDIDIDDWTFNGFIDLVFEDENGRLIIRDYKSKASFKNEQEKKEYARQLYLYSLYVKEQYGKYPDELQFLMFRKNDLISIPFDIDALNEAIEWAKDTVRIIRNAFDYPPTCDEFYAQNLCNHREYCAFKKKPKTSSKSKK